MAVLGGEETVEAKVLTIICSALEKDRYWGFSECLLKYKSPQSMARETFIAKVNQRAAGFAATSLGNQWVIAIIVLLSPFGGMYRLHACWPNSRLSESTSCVGGLSGMAVTSSAYMLGGWKCP